MNHIRYDKKNGYQCKSKFYNRKTVIDGLEFDSEKEGERYLEEEIMDAICEQLNTGDANETALERIRLLQRRGYPLKEIEKAIKKATGLSNKELSKVYGGAIERNKAYFGGVLGKLKLVFSKTRKTALDAEIDALTRQTKGTFENISQSLGFVYHDSSGKLGASPIKDAYEKILNDTVMHVQSGAFDYNTAIRNAVRKLSDSGIQTIDYESGYHCRVDVAVRRAVMTAITQISAKYTDALMEECETDLLEVTAHPGARDKDGPKGWENHKAWQGKVYSKKSGDKYPSVYDICGLDDVAGLCGANCRHHYHAFVDGVNERTYTDDELANIDKPPFTYQGKTYSAYEATQKQRQIESSLRNIKRRLIMEKQAGLNDDYTADSIKYKRLYDEYEKFSKAAALPKQDNRAFVEEFTGKDHKIAVKTVANNSKINVENSARSDKMKSQMETVLEQEGRETDIPEKYNGDFSEYEPLDLTENEIAKFKELHELSKVNNYEYVCAEINGNFTEISTSKMESTVNIPKYETSPGTKIFHSHTNNTLFSRTDFYHLFQKDVSEIGVITNNGDVFIAVSDFQDDTIPIEDYEKVVNRIAEDVDNDFLFDPEYMNFTEKQKVYMSVREQAYRIARYFGWRLKGGRL